MEAVDILSALQTFEVIVDTREQDTLRARKRYQGFGVPFARRALPYGDYAGSVTLPDGSKSLTEFPQAVIERKMDLDELASCMGRERKRFKAEFERAREHGARIYLVVENGSWAELIGGKYRSRMKPNALIGSLTAFMVRYNANILFCSAHDSPRIIKEVLYRDIKERLERGDYG